MNGDSSVMVWVVTGHSWEGSQSWTVGVFTNLERAQRCAARYARREIVASLLDPETMP